MKRTREIAGVAQKRRRIETGTSATNALSRSRDVELDVRALAKRLVDRDDRLKLFSEAFARGCRTAGRKQRRQDWWVFSTAKKNEHRVRSLLGDLVTQSGRYEERNVASSARMTSTTRALAPIARCTRSQMKRDSSSPVGTSLPSANSGTSRLMLR